MLFNSNSALTRTWVRLVQNGTYTRDQIPNIGNLREAVNSVLDAEQPEQEVL